jgi:hypothetical protein
MDAGYSALGQEPRAHALPIAPIIVRCLPIMGGLQPVEHFRLEYLPCKVQSIRSYRRLMRELVSSVRRILDVAGRPSRSPRKSSEHSAILVRLSPVYSTVFRVHYSKLGIPRRANRLMADLSKQHAAQTIQGVRYTYANAHGVTFRLMRKWTALVSPREIDIDMICCELNTVLSCPSRAVEQDVAQDAVQ